MKHNLYKKGWHVMLLFILGLFITSCDFDFELPEAGSIADETLPVAAFSFSQTDPEDYRVVSFSNESVSATDYSWDFGGASTSDSENPSFTYPGEGVYTVTLMVSDKNGISDEVTREIEVIEPEEPDAIVPDVVNGDFSEGQDGWKISSFTGGTTSPFNTSSDGSSKDYDGNDTGAKTAGAKWTMSTSAGAYLSDNTRFAYQAFTVSPNTKYTVEWEYAIKNDVDDAPGGDRLGLSILDGHFSDGSDALEANIINNTEGLEALGKGNFTVVKTEFESNGSGEIAIWIYGVTNEDAYVDNVKLYPSE
ncbi:MAG: PKD domain-containing protein [Saprospiraceae bacterium]|nr:PKD domain-containing protein [Saprospiraceae bacterium]